MKQTANKKRKAKKALLPSSQTLEQPRDNTFPWHWLAISAVLLLCAGIRFHLRDVALERDEGEYGYAGQLMLQGVPPYKLAYNMKLPGTYASYALIEAVFGQTGAGIHLGLLMVNAATVIIIFQLGRKLFGNPGWHMRSQQLCHFFPRPKCFRSRRPRDQFCRARCLTRAPVVVVGD